MNDEFLFSNIVSCGGFHLNSIVTVAKLSQTEATKNTQIVYLIKEVFVTVSVQSIN